MLTGYPPFSKDEINKHQIYHKIMTEPIVIPEGINSDAADLVNQLLQKDPEERLTDPTKIKAHKFFKDIDWIKLEAMELASTYSVKGLINPPSSAEDEFVGFTYMPESGPTIEKEELEETNASSSPQNSVTVGTSQNVSNSKSSKSISRNRIRSVTEPPNVMSRPEVKCGDKNSNDFENFTYISKEFRSLSSPEEVDEHTRRNVSVLLGKEQPREEKKRLVKISSERILNWMPGRLRSKKLNENDQKKEITPIPTVVPPNTTTAVL